MHSNYRTIMTSPSTAIAYVVPASASIRLNSHGIRAPREPWVQARRNRRDFVCFLVSDGEIHLTDEMPDALDLSVVLPGELHIVAPGIWQSSTEPFPPGSRFYWLHWIIDGDYRIADAAEATAIVRREIARASGQPIEGPEECLIPRQFSLGEDLGWFAYLHRQIQESARLPIGGTRGPDLLAQAFLAQIQRRFMLSLLDEAAGGESGTIRTHVRRACVFIRLNAHRAISTRHVAGATGLNSAYLQRCFKKELNCTVGDFILDQRITLARQLLQDPNLSIKEIAHQSGFASSTYFGRSFMRTVGCTPTEFRGRIHRLK
jgi:AraC-like DNA-binding protein